MISVIVIWISVVWSSLVCKAHNYSRKVGFGLFTQATRQDRESTFFEESLFSTFIFKRSQDPVDSQPTKNGGYPGAGKICLSIPTKSVSFPEAKGNGLKWNYSEMQPVYEGNIKRANEKRRDFILCGLGWLVWWVGCDDLWWGRQQLPEVDGASKSFLLPQHLSVPVLFFPVSQSLLILTNLDWKKYTLKFGQIYFAI